MKRLLAVLLVTGCATTSAPWTQTTVAESYEPDTTEGYLCRERCDDVANIQERSACWQACHDKHGGDYTAAQQERCVSKGTQITCEPVQ